MAGISLARFVSFVVARGVGWPYWGNVGMATVDEASIRVVAAVTRLENSMVVDI